jgi:hypothetical protein
MTILLRAAGEAKFDKESNKYVLFWWCHMSKPHDFIEVTEWHNGEGVDVCINSNGEQRFSLTWGQYEALQALVTYKE